MHQEFCTITDQSFLPRCLLLYGSLVRASRDFGLHVLCMDDETSTVLNSLNLPSVTTKRLADIETWDAELLAVKKARTLGEYCWTLKPALCLYTLAIERNIERITYLDADVSFFSDPVALLDELGDASVLLVPERNPYFTGKGSYNAGCISFRKVEAGMNALHWWRDRCLEWCFDRVEDGKFADQAYLDDVADRFRDVQILQHPGAGVAPWNGSYHSIERQDGSLVVDGRPLVFYHFQSVRLSYLTGVFRRSPRLAKAYWSSPTRVRLFGAIDRGYSVSAAEKELLWLPYLRQLQSAIASLRGFDTTAERDIAFGRRVAGEVALQVTLDPLRTTSRRLVSATKRLGKRRL